MALAKTLDVKPVLGDTSMVVNANIACSIMEAVGNVEPGDNYSDFKVIVEGRRFSCHRFILNACSGFFSALLRSGMRESIESTVTVNGIPSEIFALILECLYKGKDIVMEDNVIELWHASNLLQISFLVTHCEKFIVENLIQKCYLDVYRHAKMLDSGSVVKAALELMIKEFGAFSSSSSFVYLHYEDLKTLIESDDLNVPTEDAVVNAVLKWVAHTQANEGRESLETKALWYESEDCGLQAKIETTDFDGEGTFEMEENSFDVKRSYLGQDGHICTYLFDNCSTGTELGLNQVVDHTSVITGLEVTRMSEAETPHNIASVDETFSDISPNLRSKSADIDLGETKPRKEYLAELLAACRISLVSPDCIETLLNSDLVLDSKEALAVVREAVVYQLKRSLFWPPSAVYRATSKMENMVVFVEDKNLKLYSLRRSKVYQLTTIPEGAGVTTSIRVANNQIFLTKNVSTGFSTSFSSLHSVFAYVFPKTWLRVVEHSDSNHLLVPHDEFLYVVTGSKLYRLGYEHIGLGNASLTIVCCLPSNIHNCAIHTYATFGKNILLFCGHAVTMIVVCINTQTFKVSVLENLDGPAEGVISFGDGKNMFILQVNGALYKIVTDSDAEVSFQFLTKLWGFDWNLQGAIVFKQQLFLFGNTVSENRSWSPSLPGYFNEIKIVHVKSSFQCLPIIIPKQWLGQDPALGLTNFLRF